MAGAGHWIVWMTAVLLASQVQPDPEEIFRQAARDFESARLEESVAGFDAVARMVPEAAPQFWQRGIALYYLGRYEDCRTQFESHRRVNPNDVENAAWHFLCVAALESADAAREALLPVGPDPRVPMREIYEMFRGAMTPEEVLAAAGRQDLANFYAELYVGLYFEATGDDARALEHLGTAASDRYAVGGTMHAVARMHPRLRQRQD